MEVGYSPLTTQHPFLHATSKSNAKVAKKSTTYEMTLTIVVTKTYELERKVD